MVGLAVLDTIERSHLVAATAARGEQLRGPDHNVVRWLAPLDVSAAEIDGGADIFGHALAMSR